MLIMINTDQAPLPYGTILRVLKTLDHGYMAVEAETNKEIYVVKSYCKEFPTAK